ncbi:BQ5605_C043g12099 [Microbotryum silenes-dioicae]|uniref:BQ5605_C043g12099 protein n=1 Tax=Microbotryum silenes-dioicae TaxID=796604 RepID=A0A2X0PP92_9BASI|nr:BQ5605_C043g12099 [Microbotryum silenes-dioicae]
MRVARTLLQQRQHGSPLAYATQLVRKTDLDSLWSVLAYPQSVRPAYLCLRAFNVELATIDDQVSNPIVGRMRYQWWRDTIKQTFELLHSLPQFDQLSAYHLLRIINAREQHFLNPHFHSLQDLAEYSASTQSSLLYLLLQATATSTSSPHPSSPGALSTGKRHEKLFEHVGHEHDHDHDPTSSSARTSSGTSTKQVDDLTLDHAASHIAVTNTIATLLRSIPHHAQKRINVIPTEIASRYDVKEEALFRQGPSTPGLTEAVATMVGIAYAELRTARSCFNDTTGIPKRARPVFLSLTPARSWLDRLAKEDGDKAFEVFNPRVLRTDWKLPVQIWRDSRRALF